MAGTKTSGDRKRKTDEQKLAAGRVIPATETDAAQAAARADKLTVGPWVDTIPEPSITLGLRGRAKYDSLCRSLFLQGRLTETMLAKIEMVARIFDEEAERAKKGKFLTAQTLTMLERLLYALGTVENGPTIAGPKKKRNPYQGHGFPNRTSPTQPVSPPQNDNPVRRGTD